MVHRVLSTWLPLCLVAALGFQHWRWERRFDELHEHLQRPSGECGPLSGQGIQAALTSPIFAEQVAESVQRRLQPTPVGPVPPPAQDCKSSGSARETGQVADARTQATEQAFERATDILEDAVQKRRLARADVLAMREQLSLMHDISVSDELRRNVARAVNAHQLEIEDPMFIFP